MYFAAAFAAAVIAPAEVEAGLLAASFGVRVAATEFDNSAPAAVFGVQVAAAEVAAADFEYRSAAVCLDSVI